jgi:integrase
MLLIAVLIGLRISEIMGLCWSDIDLEAATLTVERRWYRGGDTASGTFFDKNSGRH